MGLPASGRHYREPDRRIADQAASECRRWKPLPLAAS